jgi:endonuclease/exonuclease/phosphatase family metal-dependent hydrolase
LRTACALIQIAGGPALVVYGTVLPWLGSSWNQKPSRGGVAYIAALEEQKKDWSELRQKYPLAMICVAGDFNQDLRESGHYYGSKVQRAALRDALAQTQLKCYTAGEEDPVAKQKHGSFNIDHICLGGLPSKVSITTDAWSGEQQGQSISDHFGVKVELSIVNEDL